MLGDNIPKIRSGGGVEDTSSPRCVNPPSFPFFPLWEGFPLSGPSNCSRQPSHSFGKSGFGICQRWSGWRRTFYCASKQSSRCFKIPGGCGWHGCRRGQPVCTVKASWYSGRKSLPELLGPSRAGELNLFGAIKPFSAESI